jgi:hypothetical protein
MKTTSEIPNPKSETMKFFSTVMLCIGLIINGFSQKLLKLDSGKNPNAMVYQVGSSITFQLAGESRNWHTDYIEAIDYDLKSMTISTGVVAVRDIVAVRDPNPYPFLRKIAYGLQIFALSGAVWSSIGFALKSQNSVGFLILSACCGATGWVIAKLTRHKTYHVGKNRRAQLRVLDLTPLSNPNNA